MVEPEVVVAMEVEVEVVVEECADDLRTVSCSSFSHTLISTDHACTLSLSLLVLNQGTDEETA